MDPYRELLGHLSESAVRFLVVGVTGVNYYALPGQTLFATEDLDLFLPLDPANLLGTWKVCEDLGFTLTSSGEPLERPLDLLLAERVVERGAAISGSRTSGERVDLTLVMAGTRFEEVWERKRIFVVDGIDVPVAPLGAIVESKRRAGRKKDLLFLVSHEEILEELLGGEQED